MKVTNEETHIENKQQNQQIFVLFRTALVVLILIILQAMLVQ